MTLPTSRIGAFHPTRRNLECWLAHRAGHTNRRPPRIAGRTEILIAVLRMLRLSRRRDNVGSVSWLALDVSLGVSRSPLRALTASDERGRLAFGVHLHRL